MSGELFVELLVEEIPASMVRPALAGLRDGLLKLIEGVEHGEVRTWATPRRFAVAIEGVAAARPTTETEVTGPPADRAFVDGAPTKVAEGFAKGKGVAVEDLYVVEMPKRGPVVAAKVTEGGERLADLLADGMAAIVDAIPFKKSMVWGDGGLTFGRPLHRISVVYAGAPVAGEAHGIAFAAETLGHRQSPGPVSFTSASSWIEGLRAHHVEPDLAVRAARIRELLDLTASELGADPIVDDELSEEVLHLVEWPVPVVGTFDAELLDLPPKLLVTSMKVHQRYFPVFVDGKLTNRFVVVANNPFADAALVADGNARVLRARFHDAKFFLAEDRKKTLAQHGEGLVRMRWIRGLGTMADKTARVGGLAATLAPLVGADADAAGAAGALAKADLTTQMVGEFPELQGHMGMLYARHDGLSEDVATAIEAHWQPKGASDDVAQTPTGVAVALADRLDTLVGAFGIGLKPKGGDPQGLRRAALGVVRTLLAHGHRTSLDALLAPALASWQAGAQGDGFEAWTKARGTDATPTDGDVLVAELAEFVIARFQAAQVSAGRSPDVVEAVLAVTDARHADLVLVDAMCAALVDLAGTPAFPDLLQTFKRVLNITGDVDVALPSASDCPDGPERALRIAAAEADAAVESALGRADAGAALAAVVALAAPVDAFFEAVLVNDPDDAIRARRQGILLSVAAAFRRVADLSRISTR